MRGERRKLVGGGLCLRGRRAGQTGERQQQHDGDGGSHERFPQSQGQEHQIHLFLYLRTTVRRVD